MSDLTAAQVAQLASRIARIPVTMARWYGTTVTAAYTLTPQDRELRVDTTSGAITVTLPLANTVPLQVFTIKNVGSTGNAVTVNRAGTDTIDGATSLTIPSLQSETIISAATAVWDRVGANYGAGLTYETGTWTPVIGGSGGTSGQTYSSQVGRYTKIGRMVHVHYDVTLSNKGTITTTVQIQGLPYAAGLQQMFLVPLWTSLNTAVICVPAILANGATAASLSLVTAAIVTSGTTGMTTTDVTNTTRFAGHFSYQV